MILFFLLLYLGHIFPGQNDIVRCFYCKGGLKSWAGPLRPWVEHARFYPQCPFVGQVKGQEFIDVVQELKERQDTVSLTVSFYLSFVPSFVSFLSLCLSLQIFYIYILTFFFIYLYRRLCLTPALYVHVNYLTAT